MSPILALRPLLLISGFSWCTREMVLSVADVRQEGIASGRQVASRGASLHSGALRLRRSRSLVPGSRIAVETTLPLRPPAQPTYCTIRGRRWYCGSACPAAVQAFLSSTDSGALLSLLARTSCTHPTPRPTPERDIAAITACHPPALPRLPAPAVTRAGSLSPCRPSLRCRRRRRVRCPRRQQTARWPVIASAALSTPRSSTSRSPRPALCLPPRSPSHPRASLRTVLSPARTEEPLLLRRVWLWRRRPTIESASKSTSSRTMTGSTAAPASAAAS